MHEIRMQPRVRMRLLRRGIVLSLMTWTCSSLHANDLNALLERMEPGSIIKDLLIPRYDENKKASMVLRADQMLVESLKSITAKNITLHLITSRSNKALNASFYSLSRCRYDLATSTLQSDSTVEAVSANFLLHSQGLITKIEKNQTDHSAFLLPPVHGFINPNSDDTIAMNRTRQSLILAAALTAQAAAQGTPAETAASPDAFFSVTPRTQAIDAQLQEFAKKHQVTIAPIPVPALPDAEVKPVDAVQPIPQFSPAADALGFACKGGVFYDSKTASLTLLKDVTVRNPQYAMTVKGEVKILFDQAADQKKASPEKPKDGEKKAIASATNSLGDIKQLFGSGGVALEAVDKNGVKNFASGDEVVYEMSKEELHLKGRKLVFQQGVNSRFESASANAWLRFNLKTKDFTMSEGWNARLTLPSQKNP
ncbi:MAG: hypothetical protein ACOVRB_05100 [Akkermansiaceae bacterium]